MQNHKKYMRMAIQLSELSVKSGGGPFGAVVVKDDKVIASSSNSVTTDNDPTAHAEVNAIRKAATELGTYDLSGCTIYSSCEPCPMCLGAIYWAQIDELYYANTKEDASSIGFDDSFIYSELALPHENRKVKTKQMLRNEALNAFNEWENNPDKQEY
jgi:guanine deaminase